MAATTPTRPIDMLDPSVAEQYRLARKAQRRGEPLTKAMRSANAAYMRACRTLGGQLPHGVQSSARTAAAWRVARAHPREYAKAYAEEIARRMPS